MDQQIFTDGIGRITVIGGVVRLDLVTYSPNETDAQGKPRQVFTQRLVMGTEAFLRSSEKVLEIVHQLSHPGAHVQPPKPAAVQPQVQPQAQQPQPKGEPPYTNGPLFPAKPEHSEKPADKPAKTAPFP